MRATIVRGIQLLVLITLAVSAWFAYDSVHRQHVALGAGFADLRLGWLAIGAVLALQEGVFGGLRIWVLGRVLSKELRLRTAIISEFVLMFAGGVTPGQAGAPPAQIAVLVNGGMRFLDASTAELLTALCTVTFFLVTAIVVFVLGHDGRLVLAPGAHLDGLLGLSVVTFGAAFVALILCGARPEVLRAAVRVIAPALSLVTRSAARALSYVPLLRERMTRRLARPDRGRERMLAFVDDMHRGFMIYWRRGKVALLVAQVLTFGFFLSRFAVAYCVIRGLGLSTTPDRFVAIGSPIVQIVLVQAVLNFALYLSPTPGASGIAEAGASTLMSPWLKGPYELAYIALWRFLSLFLCMFVGGVYVFRYLGTDVLEKRIAENEAAAAESRG
ncbi:MAG: flippase-like domain-containing protein [Labilithrix sp.]|nr:flippase-like domain-containing protein [Labilithrix sp.]